MTEYDRSQIDAGRHQAAMLRAIAVMMYILSFLPLLILEIFGAKLALHIGVPFMFFFVAGATGILVYNSMTRPRGGKDSGTMVGEFREWQAGTRDRHSLRRSLSAALWSVVVALYFIASFLTGAWHVTWVIFLVTAAVEAIINILFSLKK